MHKEYIPASLNALRNEAHRIASEKGFSTEQHPAVDIALMHSELSEALEVLRTDLGTGADWTKTTYSYPGVKRLTDKAVVQNIATGEDVRGKPEGVPAELADTIIRILDFCGKHKIDIEAAVHEKMAYNESRPHKHGKQF